MEKIDWSKAPEGATHYSPPHLHFVGLWARQIDGVWHYHTGKGCWYYGAQPLGGEKYIPRPSPAWSGEGLPPVGSVLEYMWNYKPEGSEYVQVEILVHDKGSAVMRTLDGPDPGVLRESRGGNCGPERGQPIFRLIRTPEQIAADERLHEIRNALTAINSKVRFPSDVVRGNILAAAVEAMIDAGYRKVEQPK